MGDKDLVLLSEEIKTPPFTANARLEAGFLLRRLQQGERIGLPHSRPMPSIGSGCHELRIDDRDVTWRIVYRTDRDTIIVAHIFAKKTRATPRDVITLCKARYHQYDEDRKEMQA